MENTVQVKDILPHLIAPPYTLGLARAVTGPYMNNGARYVGVHLARRKMKNEKFLLTGIIDETTANQKDERGKLMVQGGVQHGCSARECHFCVFDGLPFYGNLSVAEIVDIFRASLFLYSKVRPLQDDERTLDIKFTDDGEPLENKNLIEAIESLTELFSIKSKRLLMKVSSIFRDNPAVHRTFDSLCDWQEKNRKRVSIHLQVSRPYSGSTLLPGQALAKKISQWKIANPLDTVCITPGLSKNFDPDGLYDFCRDLQGVTSDIFFRMAVIKPSTEPQRSGLLIFDELEEVRGRIAALGFDVRPLPFDKTYQDQLQGAGTLSHLPNGKLYEPYEYQVWEYEADKIDPNSPLNQDGSHIAP